MNNCSVVKVQSALVSELENVLSSCTQCGACVRDCSFLQCYGSPYELADKYSKGLLGDRVSFSCSLCRLCTAVCPEKIDPARLLWLMRCQQVENGNVDFGAYRAVLFYERLGLSNLFSQYYIPQNCRTAFFPGCALPGTRPAQFEMLTLLLQKMIPDVGVILGCCAKPSHDLGRLMFFRESFGRLHKRILESNIETIITACPSCHQIFVQYGCGVKIKTIYEVFDEHWSGNKTSETTLVTVHDPCNARFDKHVQKSVRSLLSKMGLPLLEMRHRGKRTFCCGEGGAAFCVAGGLAGSWIKRRWKEMKANHMVSYCAGCTDFLGKDQQVSHIVDLIFDKKQALAGKTPVSRSPFTYLNRLKLKRKLTKYFT